MQELVLRVNKGVFLEFDTTLIALDPLVLPVKKPAIVLISHAHQDHYSPSVLRKLPPDTKIVMSVASRRIIDPRGILRNIVEVAPGEVIELGKARVEVFDAGHIIGSLQFLIDLGGREIVYTGDFNLERRIILKPATPIRSDILLMDATYGLPTYVFPSRKEIYSDLLSLIKKNNEKEEIALKARKLGVAQEVTALISMATHLPVLVEPEIAVYNEIYENFGEILGRYAISDKPAPGAPLVAKLSRKFPRKIRSIPLTGWATKSGIPLSSHGDFKQLVEYVKQSNPQLVIPVCGFREDFARHVSEELGFEASHEEEIIVKM